VKTLIGRLAGQIAQDTEFRREIDRVRKKVET